jgi:hypothetical protein
MGLTVKLPWVSGSTDIFPDYSQTRHCDACVQHRHQIIGVFVGTSLQFLCLPPIESFVVVDGLSFECLNLILELNALLFLLLLLGVGPVQNPLGLFFVKSELLLLF